MPAKRKGAQPKKKPKVDAASSQQHQEFDSLTSSADDEALTMLTQPAPKTKKNKKQKKKLRISSRSPSPAPSHHGDDADDPATPPPPPPARPARPARPTGDEAVVPTPPNSGTVRPANVHVRRNSTINLTDEQHERLADWYKERPYLYSQEDRNFKNTEKRNSAIQEIAHEMGETFDKMKTYLDGVKTRFRKIMQRERSMPSGSGQIEVKPHEEKILRLYPFLRDHIKLEKESNRRFVGIPPRSKSTSRRSSYDDDVLSFHSPSPPPERMSLGSLLYSTSRKDENDEDEEILPLLRENPTNVSASRRSVSATMSSSTRDKVGFFSYHLFHLCISFYMPPSLYVSRSYTLK